MQFPTLLIVLLVAVSMSEAQKRGKPGWRKKIKKMQANKNVNERLTELEEQLASMTGSGEEVGCLGNNVHFFFHGDDDHSADDDGTHVHVHLDHDGHHHNDHVSHHAVCTLTAVEKGIAGTIFFWQDDDADHLMFDVNITHLGSPNTEYAMHVHEFGDVSHGCSHTGGHFDTNTDDEVDESDLGHFFSDNNGHFTSSKWNDIHVSLFGKSSIVGHSIAVNHGNTKAGCCVIGWATDDGEHNHDHDDHHDHDHDHDHHDDDHDHDHDNDHHHDHHGHNH